MLKINNLKVRYDGVEALKGVNLSVGDGELVALIGSNGAGKTSLLKAISGLITPSAGSIQIQDRDLISLGAHKRVQLGIAHCPEGRKVFAQMNVLDNLLLGAFVRRNSDSQVKIQESIDEIFAIFPRLKERSTQVAGTLSGGEQQMLAIGRALMLKPKILMLDEPSMGLAPVIIDEVFKVIEKIKKTTTILLVEQLAYRALEIADRAYVLEQGLIRTEGTAAELKNSPEVRAAYLGG